MRLFLGSRAFLLGPAIALILANGCGASEGSRCQIDSDCASGLVCSEGSTGNGTCRPSHATGTAPADAGARPDANLSTGPEVEPVVEPAVDAASPADAGTVAELGPTADGATLAEVGPTADGATLAEVGVGTLDGATASVDSDTTSTQ
jgi:hypothetical protein